MGFAITSDDVISVLGQQGVLVDDDTAQALIDDHLNDAAIEKAALRANDLDEQTEAAYAEILNQLKADGHLAALQAQEVAKKLDAVLPAKNVALKPRM